MRYYVDRNTSDGERRGAIELSYGTEVCRVNILQPANIDSVYEALTTSGSLYYGGEEGVFIKQPLFFGEGGVQEQALTHGSEWKVFSTSFVKYSTVGLPGLIPGINPPCLLILFATSNGLKVMDV